MKKLKPSYNGVEYDSNEEIEFQIFLDDCALYGLIDTAVYQPDPLVLAPKATRRVWKHFKTKPSVEVERHLFFEHVYTADWYVVWTPKFLRTFPHCGLLLRPCNTEPRILDLKEEQSVAAEGWVDVKGGYNRHGGDRVFPIHQKLSWYLHKVPVNKIVPKDFFRKLGAVPDGLKWMKGRKTKTAKTAYKNLPTIGELFD